MLVILLEADNLSQGGGRPRLDPHPDVEFLDRIGGTGDEFQATERPGQRVVVLGALAVELAGEVVELQLQFTIHLGDGLRDVLRAIKGHVRGVVHHHDRAVGPPFYLVEVDRLTPDDFRHRHDVLLDRVQPEVGDVVEHPLMLLPRIHRGHREDAMGVEVPHPEGKRPLAELLGIDVPDRLRIGQVLPIPR